VEARPGNDARLSHACVEYANWTEYHDITHGGHGLLAHNIFIQAGSEVGYQGLLAFLAMVAAAFVINRRALLLVNRLSDRGKFVFCMARGLDGSLCGTHGQRLFH